MAIEDFKRPPLTNAELLAKVPPSDILVADSDLESYLQRTNGEYRRLPNGMTIVGFARGTIDNIDTEVTVQFPHFPALDPRNKRGITHLTEHMLGRPLDRITGKLLVDQNAYTSWDNIGYEVAGDSAPVTDSVGLFPFIQALRNALADPISNFYDPEETLKGEIERVLDEINIKANDHTQQISDTITKIPFSPDNPYSSLHDKRGIPEHISGLTIDEVIEHAARILIPRHALIEVYAQGSPNTNKQFIDRLEAAFSDFPRTDSVHDDLPEELVDTYNPEFQPGTIFTHDTGIRNRRVNVLLLWKAHTIQDTPREFGFYEFTQQASEATDRTSRRMRWGYTTDTDFLTKPGNTTLFYVSAGITTNNGNGNIPKDPERFAADFTDEVKEHVLNISTEEVASGNTSNRLLRQLRPVSTSKRLSEASRGIRRYGRLIDADKVKGIRDEVETTDVTSWRDQFLDTPPVTVIVGDLGKHRK